MTSSLVGSEMCIRDRKYSDSMPNHTTFVRLGFRLRQAFLLDILRLPVSYTHLTLPTICSV
eukprot:8775909-Prorocentrum_lima.AAC.1